MSATINREQRGGADLDAVLSDATIDDVGSVDVAVLAASTPWIVAWDLMVRGPFDQCVLRDGPRFRHLTPEAMFRSALWRRAEKRIPPEDFAVVQPLAPGTTLRDAVRSLAEQQWEIAVVTGSQPRLVTARAVLRQLARLVGEPHRAVMQPGGDRGRRRPRVGRPSASGRRSQRVTVTA